MLTNERSRKKMKHTFYEKNLTVNMNNSDNAINLLAYMQVSTAAKTTVEVLHYKYKKNTYKNK